MSISSLANAAAARRSDFAPLGGIPQGLAEIASASGTAPAPLRTRQRHPHPAGRLLPPPIKVQTGLTPRSTFCLATYQLKS